jgi:hypothetical protein
MEPPTIPDHRPHKIHTIPMDDINGPALKGSAQNSLRSDSPAAQAYEPQAFGQPSIGRPPMGSRQRSSSSRPQSRPHSALNNIYPKEHNGYGYPNGDQPSRQPSIDQESVAESTDTLDLGHQSIGRLHAPSRSENRLSISSNNFDQRSLSNLSIDQQSIGTQSLGHHSIGGTPGGYYS